MNKFEEDYYDDYYDYEYDEHGNIIGFKDKPSHPQADQPPGIGLVCLQCQYFSHGIYMIVRTCTLYMSQCFCML